MERKSIRRYVFYTKIHRRNKDRFLLFVGKDGAKKDGRYGTTPKGTFFRA